MAAVSKKYRNSGMEFDMLPFDETVKKQIC